ncbi:MAG: hypothetical protein WBQ44_10895 [Rhodococcus sp. (in: high G+C Gram-positive bacteria)]
MSASIPLPGQHRPHNAEAPAVDPAAVETEVDTLLDRLPADGDAPMDMNVQAQILERAHEILVQALSSVDKS